MRGIGYARDRMSVWRTRLGAGASVGKFYGRISWRLRPAMLGRGRVGCSDEEARQNTRGRRGAYMNESYVVQVNDTLLPSRMEGTCSAFDRIWS